MDFDVAGARKAGYTDAEIAEFLARESDFDIAGARKAGYGDSDIIAHLSGGTVEPQGPIDDTTGASWRERFIIGSAVDPKVKLERAKAIYGDSARMDNDGRLSFISPATGRRTYVNPSGFDFGDILGGAREIGSAVASIPAGIAGAIGGGGLNIATGALAGSAAGAAAGQGIDALAAQMARSAARERGNTVPAMQSPADALKEAGAETAIGTIGGTGLGLAGKGLVSALNPMRQEVVNAFRQLNIPMGTVGTGVGGKGSAIYENALGSVFGGTGAMERANMANLTNFNSAIGNTANRIAGGQAAPNVVELGILAQDAAGRAKQAFQNENRAFYDAITKQWGTQPANMSATRAAIDDMTGGLSPTVREKVSKSLLDRLEAEATDEAKDALNVNTIASARTRLGEALNSPQQLDTDGVTQGQLRRIYGALTDDYMNAISDPAVAQNIAQHKAQEAAHHKAAELLESKIFGQQRLAQGTGEALTRKDLAPEVVEAMRTTFSPEDFNAIRGGILNNIGVPLSSEGRPAEAASAAQFSKMLGYGRGGLSPQTQAALWPEPEIDHLRTVSDAIANVARNANTSKTAQTNAAIGFFTGLNPQKIIQLGTAAGAYSPLGFVGPASTVAVPWGLSRLTTSQPVINFLARPQSAASRVILEEAAPIAGRLGGLLGRMQEE